jgi:FMN phosphatase YigB (HAD superfamily)
MVGEGKKPLAAVMGAVAAQYPEEFLEDKDDKDSVVRFTDLRKAALANMAKDAGYEDPGATAEECFDVWIKARHDVLSLLYPGTIDMMARLKARGLRLCAITNGNCDVMLVEALAAHLDFCVNAERVGARKRTGKPYEAAFKLAGTPTMIVHLCSV